MFPTSPCPGPSSAQWVEEFESDCHSADAACWDQMPGVRDMPVNRTDTAPALDRCLYGGGTEICRTRFFSCLLIPSTARARVVGAASCIHSFAQAGIQVVGKTCPQQAGAGARQADTSVDNILYSHESIVMGAPRQEDGDESNDSDLPECIVGR